MRRLTFGVLAAGLALGAAPDRAMIEWPFYGGDQAGSKWSAASDINRRTVSRLDVAWTWKPDEKPLPQFGTQPGSFENTPLMIDNVLYVSTPYNRVVALDAGRGREIWTYDPHAYEDGQPPNGTGFVHRGVAAWRDRGRLRIFINSRHRLICLDAATGQPVASFGSQGAVDLVQGLKWTVDPKQYTNTSPPVVFRDLVIVGNGVGDRLAFTKDPPGDVQAFDAHTGRRAWIFHTVPQAGEPGTETWEADSWRITGHTNVWAPMTLDERRGLLYLPVSTPSNDFYGGRRLGQNLYADSIVCLDAATGVRKWHFQIVHHGLWDYDPPSPPNVVSIRPDGRSVDAVVQLTKQGLVFVFDRLTGKPVWPIEERSVPASDMPGEHAWPTQPFPTRPPALEEAGVSEEDAFDLTPELRAKALAELRKLRLGPLYTPPSAQGTLQRPGIIGGANWGGAAFDAASGRLFVKTSNQPHVARLSKPDRSANNPRAAEVDADYTRAGDTTAEFMNGLPLLKPPYAHLTAIDLNRGSIAWRVPFGDLPSLREHPALKGVALPDVLGAPGAPGTIGTAGGLLFVGGGDAALHAVDTDSGRDLWRGALPRRSTATPMTYRASNGVQYVVIAVGARADAELVAFALRK
ncbi:MAG TPA: pyrroloquinoline quinone-dependent dehydrogenase [Vicinamibacterales bacterium]|nr:pyrroloquinoline quinone-dependent dehydrogenase [Vicinamibacterales bacterium]